MTVIRPAKIEDAAAMACVHVDTWRTAYPGIVPEEFLANLSYERCQAGWLEVLTEPQSQTHAFVAENEQGEIVAIVSCGPIREAVAGYDGELYTLYVLKSWQGTGCGKQLVRKVAQDLASRGYHTMLIWVLKDNPACRFYERLGGRLTTEREVEIGGKQLVDVGYVWLDLAVFKD